MAEFFCCCSDDDGSLTVEKEGKGLAFGRGSYDGFHNAALLVHSPLARFVLLDRGVVTKVEVSSCSTAGALNG